MSELIFQCACGNKLRMRAEHAGRTGRCSRCSARVTVPPASVFKERAGGTLTPAQLQSLLVSATAESSDVWRLGQVVDDRYEVKGLLGEGTFGSVWHVWHREWQIDLAVKEIKKRTGHGLQRFQREAQAWIDLGLHPHVVTAWYVRQLEGVPYLFLEYCEGGSLAGWIEQGRTRQLAAALDAGIQLGWGLSHCHRKGIVHRDFKPLNVLMSQDGTARVTDFGTVKFAVMEAQAETEGEGLSLDLRRTIGGQLQGTPPYMPPEQWVRGGGIDFRADLYALGVTLFEILTGRFPLEPHEGGVSHWARAHTHAEPTALRALRPDAGEDLERLVAALLSKDPLKRPADARAVSRVLRAEYEKATGRAYPRPEPEEADLLADRLNNKAVSWYDLGLTREAEAVWEEALVADPHHRESVYNLGLTRWRAGQATDSEVLIRLEQIDAAESADGASLPLQVQIHLERGDGRTACELLEKRAAGSGGPQLDTLLARAREQRGSCGECLGKFGQGDWYTRVSQDRRLVLSRRHTGELQLWDIASGALLHTVQAGDAGHRQPGLSGCGRYVLSLGKDHVLGVWDLQTGACLRSWGRQENASSLLLTRDARLSVWGTGGVLTVGATHSGERVKEVPLGYLDTACLSPDERLVVTAQLDAPELWDFPSFQTRWSPPADIGSISDVSFSPDGKLLLSGHGDSLRLWDVATGECLRTIKAGAGAARRVFLLDEGRQALTGGDHLLRLWDLGSGRCLRTLESKERPIVLAGPAADGSGAVIAGHHGGPLEVWSLSAGGAWQAPLAVSRVSGGQGREALAARAIVEDRLRLAAAARSTGDLAAALGHLSAARSQPGYARKPLVLERWGEMYRHTRKARFRGAWEHRTLKGHGRGIMSVRLSEDGRLLVSAGGFDLTARLWDVETGECLQTFEGHQNGVYDAAVSPDGRFVLTACVDKVVRLFAVETGRCLQNLTGHPNTVKAVAFSADGRLGASGSCGTKEGYADTLLLWDLPAGRRLRSFPGLTNHVYDVTFTPDARHLLAAAGDGLRLWDLAAGTCVRILGPGCTDEVAVSADGSVVAGLHVIGQRLEFHDGADGKLLKSISRLPGAPTSLALSADGRYALTGGHDHLVHLWDVASGKLLQSLLGHTGAASSVCFAPDGRFAVSAGEDTTIKVWYLDWDLEAPSPASWDDGAGSYLASFLAARTPNAADIPAGSPPGEEAVRLALTRQGRPSWSEQDWERLLFTLGCVGYGWLRPDGVRRKLEEMTAGWQEPPPAARS